MTECCSSLVHVASGAANFTPLLHRPVAFLHLTATCWPLFKPSVSLLSHMKTLNCMLQLGLPPLHYYCAILLHSCIVLPPVHRSSNHQYHCCQLTDIQAVFRIFITLLRFSFDSPSYLSWSYMFEDYSKTLHCWETRLFQCFRTLCGPSYISVV